MRWLTRRFLLTALAGAGAILRGHQNASAATPDARRSRFIEAAFAIKQQAERSGDQSYGAVIVRNDAVVGWGPSRVIIRSDWTAHAEREAIRDAQARLGTRDLAGCVMYSTSRPCANCEQAAAIANIERMFFGTEGTDAGRPRAP